MSIYQVQQLSTTQRIANNLNNSNDVCTGLLESFNLSSKLNKGAITLELLNSLKNNNNLIKSLDNDFEVTRYLLYKYIGIKSDIKLNCVQLEIAIEKLKDEINLIKYQKDNSLNKELQFTEKLLKKISKKYKNKCKKSKKCKKCF